MTSLRNSVRLTGHVGQNPEIKNLDNGKKLAKLSIAINEVYFKDGEKVTKTYWHNLVAWGKVAEVIENYVEKGREVAIEGKLINRTYDAQDGSKRYITEVQVNELILLGRKS